MQTSSPTSPSSGAGYSYTTAYRECHTGNRPVFRVGEGTLYAGGWSRGAKTAGLAVIDLTGDRFSQKGPRSETPSGRTAFGRFLERVSQPDEPWLSLYVKDYGVPVYTAEDWKALAVDLRELLSSGKSAIVCCQGGHGRTGTVVAILAGLMAKNLCGDDPIGWLRKTYCDEVVETAAQHRYVHTMLGLPEPDTSEYAVTTSYANAPVGASTVTPAASKKNNFDPPAGYDEQYGIWDDSDGISDNIEDEDQIAAFLGDEGIMHKQYHSGVFVSLKGEMMMRQVRRIDQNLDVIFVDGSIAALSELEPAEVKNADQKITDTVEMARWLTTRGIDNEIGVQGVWVSYQRTPTGPVIDTTIQCIHRTNEAIVLTTGDYVTLADLMRSAGKPSK